MKSVWMEGIWAFGHVSEFNYFGFGADGVASRRKVADVIISL